MRLLIDTRVVKGTLTGVECYTVCLLEQLTTTAGLSVTALCRDEAQVALVRKLAPAVAQCEVALSPTACRGRSGTQVGGWERFDVLHCPTPLFPFLRKPRGPRVVCTIHDVTPRFAPQWHKRSHAAYFRWVLPWLLRSVDSFLADSRASAMDLQHWYGIPASRCSVVPLASRWASEPLVLPKHDYFLAVGTLEPRKNLERVVAAFQRFKDQRPDSPLTLKIVGQSGWGATASQTRQLERPDIQWTGYLADEDLRQLYRHARALLYPSLYEGFGLPVLEAMTLGCPVVTSPGSSLPEVGGAAVLYVDPLQVDPIADALLRLADDTELVTQLSQLGQQRAAEFSWERTARETLAAYRQVLAEVA